MDLTGQGGDKTPGNDEKAEIVGWTSGVVQQQVRGDLHEDVADEKDRETGLVLVAYEVEVLL